MVKYTNVGGSQEGEVENFKKNSTKRRVRHG